MRRPLIPFALAMGIGIAVGTFAERFPLTAGLATLIVIAVTASARRALPRALSFGPRHWVLIIAAAAYTIATPPPTPDPRLLDEPVTVEAVLDDPIRHMTDWSSVTAADLRFMGKTTAEIPGRIKLSGQPDAFTGLRYGDRIRLTAQFRPPRGFRNPGLFDYGRWLERQGVIAAATVKPGGIERIGHRASPLLDPIYDWRERIRIAANASLPADVAPIFLAMVTGETGYLTAELRERFMASGTVHLLSISGSHLGLIALIIFAAVRMAVVRLPERLLLRVTMRVMPSQIAAAVTVIPVTFYALLAGGQIATMRALLMILVYLFAVLIHRHGDLLNLLAFAAIALLAWDPHALTDVSFQLSFLSVWCIALALEWSSAHEPAIEESDAARRRRRLRSAAAALLLISVAAGVGTAPLVAYHFQQVNWVGAVANPIVIPLAGALVVPLGLISGVAAAVSASPTLPFAEWNTAALHLLLRVVDFFAAWPLSIIHVAAPSIVVLAAWYVIMSMLVDRRVKPWKRGLAAGLLIILAVPALIGTPRWMSSAKLEVTFLDVGQGDSAVVRFPSGRILVVDGGKRFYDLDAGRLVLAPTLWNRDVRKIDYLVATHPQLDHLGGLLYVADRFPVGEAWSNGRRPDTWAAREYEAILARRGIATSVAPREQPLWIDAVRVWRVNPLADAPYAPLPRRATDNDRSIVLRLEYGRASFLLTGDVEAEGERLMVSADPQWNLLRSTVLKVPHHGSRGALDPVFLRAVAPRVGVISVGATNTYGHPAPQTLKAYARLKASLFRTDLDGAITMTTDGTHLDVYRYDDLTTATVRWGRGMAAAEWRNIRTALGSPTPSLSVDLTKTEPPL
ncbi:MAG: DNA internalization-related competence protein ComEC/Rec2 [Nitrospirota bacterium]